LLTDVVCLLILFLSFSLLVPSRTSKVYFNINVCLCSSFNIRLWVEYSNSRDTVTSGSRNSLESVLHLCISTSQLSVTRFAFSNPFSLALPHSAYGFQGPEVTFPPIRILHDLSPATHFTTPDIMLRLSGIKFSLTPKLCPPPSLIPWMKSQHKSALFDYCFKSGYDTV
jgi:hypothetical protein